MIGEVGILNVGAGDTKITFDPNQPEEREKAKRIVQDMLKRGYALLVQVGELEGSPIYQRAFAFDPEKCEYLIRELPPVDQPTPEEVKAREDTFKLGYFAAGGDRRPKSRKPRTRRIPAEKTHAIAVARSAGG